MYMDMLRFSGILAIVPTAILLAISFFILVLLRKMQEQELKVFGYVIAVLLWISAALIFAKGIYTLTTGCHPMRSKMQEMMKGRMQQPMMEQRGMQPPATKK